MGVIQLGERTKAVSRFGGPDGDVPSSEDGPPTAAEGLHLTIYRLSSDGREYVLPTLQEFRRVQADALGAARRGGGLVTVIDNEEHRVEIIVTAGNCVQFETAHHVLEAVDNSVVDSFVDFDQFA